MTEPTGLEMHRALAALAALAPFVRRRRISLNPEDLYELAYAVLRHARSNDGLDTITTAIDLYIDQHEANARRLSPAVNTSRWVGPDTRSHAGRSPRPAPPGAAGANPARHQPPRPHPHCNIDITRLPDDQQRRLYDAFHLELRYNTIRNEATIRVTVTSGIAPLLAAWGSPSTP